MAMSAIIVAFGSLALLALLIHRSRPTVAEALRIALFALPAYVLANLLQSMIVLSITVMSSTFLSAPLSIILGILLYLFGSIYGYIVEGTRDIDASLVEIRTGKEKAHTPEDIPVGLLWFSSKVSGLLLKVLPDFAPFDYSVWLLKDNAVSWRELAGATGKALPPILVLVALGTLLMAFKDFDR